MKRLLIDLRGNPEALRSALALADDFLERGTPSRSRMNQRPHHSSRKAERPLHWPLVIVITASLPRSRTVCEPAGQRTSGHRGSTQRRQTFRTDARRGPERRWLLRNGSLIRASRPKGEEEHPLPLRPRESTWTSHSGFSYSPGGRPCIKTAFLDRLSRSTKEAET